MKFYLLLFVSLFYHGENLATYTITKEATKVYVTANLDASDAAKAMGVEEESIAKNVVQKYLEHHLHLKINQEDASFHVETTQVKYNHLNVKIAVDGDFNTISTIQIKNSALFEVNNQQSNVVELRFDGMVRDFLINKTKPELTIAL
ncbi:MAG: DUF6702 family protein [Flavobacteriaceae bacterium]